MSRNDERWTSEKLSARRQEVWFKDHRKQEVTKDELYKSLTVSHYEAWEVVKRRGANADRKKKLLAIYSAGKMKVRNTVLTMCRRRGKELSWSA